VSSNGAGCIIRGVVLKCQKLVVKPDREREDTGGTQIENALQIEKYQHSRLKDEDYPA
jgi:hypothetical protein